MSSYITRALIVCAAMTVCLLVFSCGGSKHSGTRVLHKAAVRDSLVEWNGRHVKPLSELLDELDSLKMPSSVNPREWVAMKDNMRKWLTNTFGEGKSASKYPQEGPPTPEYVKARELAWSPEEGNTWGKLTWRYVNDGDYNQDGTVSIADISVLAMHLNESALIPNTIQELIDEDDSVNPNGNGIVDYVENGLSPDDMKTIQRDFGVDIASYEILGSADGTTWVPNVGEVEFSEGTGKEDGRAVFEWSIPNGNYRYYKVVARSFDDEPWHYDSLMTQIVESEPWQMRPPTITDVNPDACHPATPTEFTASVSSYPGSGTYRWDFGEFATPRTSSVAEPEITFQNRGHDYTATGAFYITTQFGSSNTYWLSIFVTSSGLPPDIVSVWPSQVEGEDGQEIEFSVVVNGDTPFTYAWDFDDGAIPATSTSASPTVELDNPGTHEASLTVTNSYGSDEVDFPLVVHGWITTPVDESGEVNLNISLAYDQNGEAGISYQTEECNLKYAHRSAGSWLKSSPDSYLEIPGVEKYDVGFNNSLAFNPSPSAPGVAEPGIAYEYWRYYWGLEDNVPGWVRDFSTSGVRFVRLVQGVWQVENAYTGFPGADPSLAFCGSTPYISHSTDYNDGDLHLAHRDGNNPWPFVVLDDGGFGYPHSLCSSLAVYGQQKVAAYRCITLPNYLVDVRLARYTSGVMPPTIIESILPFSDSTAELSQALNSAGLSWVAYIYNSRGFSGEMKVAREPLDNGPWYPEGINLEGGSAASPSLDFSENGVAGLAYCWIGQNPDRALKYKENIDGNWEEPTTLNVGAYSCSLSFTLDGRPSIAYVADGNLYYTEKY